MPECRHGFDESDCDLCITASRPAGERAGSRVGQSFALIYAPSLNGRTFLHLNRQGDSWKIRRYFSPHQPAEVVAQSSPNLTRQVLDLARLEIVHELAYPYSNTADGVTIQDHRYWFDQVAKANAQHRIAPDD